MKKIIYSAALLLASTVAVTSCGSDSNDSPEANNNESANNNVTVNYQDQSLGKLAVTNCAFLGDELVAANQTIGQASLTAQQEAELSAILQNIADNIIVPTYTSLADATESLETTLNGLSTSTISQEKINQACEQFKTARKYWELSEAFLGGAASDFSVDPTIDSWPLSRTALLDYFSGKVKLSEADESILGFHALEFILFRDGSPRKADAFKANDTYKGFETITGAQELKYAQEVCTLLKQRTFQLQIAWEGVTAKNQNRANALKAAGITDITTADGQTYGNNLKNAGKGTSLSNFATIKDAVAQLLSAEEGSAYAITNEVGTAKIGHPFTEGTISYVESPYSWNSITDFQDNIRSVRNIWNGSLDGTVNENSFANFFQKYKTSVNTSLSTSINNAISAIGNMPYPFVTYCCTIWNKTFSNETYVEKE